MPTWTKASITMRQCFVRLFVSQVAHSSRTPLAVLRGKTGFPIIKCKEALTRHENDVEAAEAFLRARAQEEGWAKAEALSGRKVLQGLIGVSVHGNQAAMVELNCETDFVARNEKFQALLAVATQATLAQKSPVVLDTTDHPSVDYLTPEVLKTVNIEGAAGTLANLVANAIGLLSENIIFTRGTTMSASKGLICSHIYNNTVNQPGALVGMGTYATLVHLLPADSKDSFDTRLDDIRMLGSQIGQHITGTNPASVYPQEGREEGEALLAQNFVLDSSIRVADMLREKNVKVSKFVRFALGGAETSL